MLACSSCWNAARHSCGRALVQEIRELGFEWIELSHGLNLQLLPGVIEAMRAGEIKLCGVHNFFPSPLEVRFDAPDIYECTQTRGWQRQRALNLSLKSICMAAKLQARYLVLHLGSIPYFQGHRATDELLRIAKAHGAESPQLRRARVNFNKKRQRHAALSFRRAGEFIEQLLPEAEQCGVVLGIEMRSHAEQVPSELELYQLLLQHADSPWLGYWHDFGHAERKARLGHLDHAQILTRLGSRLVGCHLHDVEGLSHDHRVPGFGSMDFEELLPLLPPRKDLPLVWELSPRSKNERIAAALQQFRRDFAALPALADPGAYPVAD